MRKFITLLVCGLLAISLFGQNQQIEALKKAVDNAANPSEKSTASIQLSEQLRLVGQFARATDWAENAETAKHLVNARRIRPEPAGPSV